MPPVPTHAQVPIPELLEPAVVAPTDGFVPASSSDLAGMVARAERPATATAEVAALEPSVLLRGLGALGAADYISQVSGLGELVAGSDLTDAALDGFNPNRIGTPDWYSWRAGVTGAATITEPGGATIATKGNVQYERGILTRRVRDALRQARTAAPPATVAPPSSSHPGLLLGLLPFAGALVLLGLVHAARALVTAVGGIIGAATGVVPFVGPFVSGGTAAATHLAVSALATAESHLDPLIAGFWQDAAKLASWAWRELTGGAAISQTLAHLAHAAAAGQRARRPSPHAVGRISAIAAAAAHARAVTAAVGAAIAHPGSTSIGAAIATRLEPLRLRALNTEARLHGADARIAAGRSRAVEAQVGGLHAETRRLQGELDAQAARTAQLEKTVAAAGGAALFVSGARRIGAGWLQCRNWRRLGRNVCGLPSNLLNDFMALLLDFLVLENICVVLPWITEAASVVGVPLVEGLAAVVGAGACGGAARSPALTVPRLHYPPARPLALHLPG